MVVIIISKSIYAPITMSMGCDYTFTNAYRNIITMIILMVMIIIIILTVIIEIINIKFNKVILILIIV